MILSVIRLTASAITLSAVFAVPASAESAYTGGNEERWNLHAKSTLVFQFHPAFRSGVRGPNSLDPAANGRETFDLTFYGGARFWRGGEGYANVEIDQGFGLSNSVGAGGYVSGEAYKIGSSVPYVRVPRLFFRQTINLGGTDETLLPGANQLATTRSSDNLVLTIGKFSVADIFDTNAYAHDPRLDFLNWSIISSGAFDYAADAWGYSYGAAAELTKSWLTLRAGVFNMSRVPNSRFLERDFSQFQAVSEAEMRSGPVRYPWKVKFLAFMSRAHMADYSDAVRFGLANGTAPDAAAVRNYRSRPGFAASLEQNMGANWGLFLRASFNDGSKEAYDFTEINKSIAGGASFGGTLWGRPSDRFGIAVAVNGLSRSAQNYFAGGGIGILIGDGSLAEYRTENILETYYSAQLYEGVMASLDYQFLANPAYNGQRGPVSVFGMRLRAQI